MTQIQLSKEQGKSVPVRVVKVFDDSLSIWKGVHVLAVEGVLPNGGSIMIVPLGGTNMADVCFLDPSKITDRFQCPTTKEKGFLPVWVVERCIEFLDEKATCGTEEEFETQIYKKYENFLEELGKSIWYLSLYH
jgi:hypothetical protein